MICTIVCVRSIHLYVFGTILILKMHWSKVIWEEVVSIPKLLGSPFFAKLVPTGHACAGSE